ncbi:hypothetical protein DPEC_G00372930 [Dallia pectoralis]|nr:hypothetical protein DPEC_G00372930 [Dallia pectoralis]
MDGWKFPSHVIIWYNIYRSQQSCPEPTSTTCHSSQRIQRERRCQRHRGRDGDANGLPTHDVSKRQFSDDRRHQIELPEGDFRVKTPGGDILGGSMSAKGSASDVRGPGMPGLVKEVKAVSSDSDTT